MLVLRQLAGRIYRSEGRSALSDKQDQGGRCCGKGFSCHGIYVQLLVLLASESLRISIHLYSCHDLRMKEVCEAAILSI